MVVVAVLTPYGLTDGFPGGGGTSYSGGGGAGWRAAGKLQSYVGEPGGGSAGSPNQSITLYCFTGQPGGSGVAGAASAAGCWRMAYTSYGGCVGRRAA